MTSSQRRYHRLLWTLLAPILLALVAGAMLLRPPPLIQPPTSANPRTETSP